MEGNGENPPFEWLLSRVCDEFNCLPSEALSELMANDRVVMDIMQLRAYSRAKEALKRAKKDEDIPDDPMIDEVFVIEREIARRQKEGRL